MNITTRTGNDGGDGNRDNPIIIILGPTATGKSDLALEVCRLAGGEVVNADSRQVYRYMNIGTAKPSPEERRAVSHHLYDIKDPGERFSAGEFVRRADEAIVKIRNRGRLPVVVGGTGLYIRALLRGLFANRKADPELRRKIKDIVNEKGIEHIRRMVERLDPASAGRIEPNDVRRLSRAIEVYFMEGGPMSELMNQGMETRYESIKIGLNMDRGLLYRTIEERIDRMMEKGFIEEVGALLERGYERDSTAFEAIGYKEIARFLDGRGSLDEAVEEMKKRTRNYAKRQLTWFRRENDIKWFIANREDMRAEVWTYLRSKLNDSTSDGEE